MKINCIKYTIKIDSKSGINFITKTYSIQHESINSIGFGTQYIAQSNYLLDDFVELDSSSVHASIYLHELTYDCDIMKQFIHRYEWLYGDVSKSELYVRELPLVTTMREYINERIYNEMQELHCMMEML